MEDWKGYDELVNQRLKRRCRVYSAQQSRLPKQKRKGSFFASLANLLRRRPKEEPEPQPARPAFR
jgi:hypothetical protein